MHVGGQWRQIVYEMIGVQLLFGQLKRRDRRLLKRFVLDVLVDQFRFRQFRQLIEKQFLMLHTDRVMMIQADHDHLHRLSIRLLVFLVQFLIEIVIIAILHRRFGTFIIFNLATFDAVLVRIDKRTGRRMFGLIRTTYTTIRLVYR